MSYEYEILEPTKQYGNIKIRGESDSLASIVEIYLELEKLLPGQTKAKPVLTGDPTENQLRFMKTTKEKNPSLHEEALEHAGIIKFDDDGKVLTNALTKQNVSNAIDFIKKQ